MPPPQPPPPMGGGSAGLGPLSPFASLLIDLPSNLGTGWQSLDIATSALKIALRSADFQKTPAVVAAVQSIINQLTTLVTTYTEGAVGGTATPVSTSSDEGGSSSMNAADADAQPASPDMSGMSDGGDMSGGGDTT